MKRLVLCAVTAVVLANSAGARTWTDSKGNSIEAEFVGLEDGVVQLRKSNGSVIEIWLNKLSEADQEFARSQSSTPGQPPPAGQSGGSQAASAPAGQGARKVAPDLPALVDRVKRSVVLIETNGGQGSGFLVRNGDLVVTNYHVVEGASAARVRFHNRRTAGVAGYLAVDPGKDLVLLRLEADSQLPVLPLHAGLPRQAEKVVAIGAPQGFTQSVTDGIVSAIRRGNEIRDVFQQDGATFPYDADSTWIQTSAPISPGNSGGPLIDMSGNVVGANAWFRADGQNLNFAIGAPEIRRLLANAAAQVHDLADLAPPEAGTRGVDPRSGEVTFRIELPSGAALTHVMVDITVDQAVALFPDKAPFHVLRYANGEILGVCYARYGRLHGPAAGFYENGALGVLANYHDSERDGPLRFRDEGRHTCVYAQYQRGRKNGLVCLFRNDLPWLVQEWKGNRHQADYLIEPTVDGLTVHPAGSLTGEAAKDLAEARQSLEEIEADMAKAESKLEEAVREEDQRLRRQRAAVAGSMKRQSMLNRAAAKGTARNAGFRNMWTAALGSSGL